MNLEDKLSQYEKSDFYPFHMPGHKRRLKPWRVENPYSVDITEIDEFDNLNDPRDLILQEEQKAAAFYKTKETLFSVNGSSACLLAAISAAVSRNGKILIGRNCHKAVYHGIYLRGLETKYLMPKVDSYNIALGISPEEVYEKLEQDDAIEAVLITSPTYEGAVSPVKEIADIVHSFGKVLIVDEAHGAHFSLHPYFPQSAVHMGADLVIQSLHKTLPALTQTALMHRCSSRISSETLRRFMQIYQSSSPSYILMGSITACLHSLQEEKADFFKNYAAQLQELRKNLGILKNIHLWTAAGADPTKLVLLPSHMSGQELSGRLREQYHLEMEMAQENLVLAMTTVGDDAEGFKRLQKALWELDLGN